ncbi:DUF4350 domain-containing protein [Streptomyces sp. NPDC006879]|uniref:DUF4350 domain-containing protein n=1 Tax=Streptomyces sp. NPDC006879 TaxID=3364767 RepID=UPI0036C1152B
MTTPAGPEPAAAPETSTTQTPQQVWRRTRGPLLAFGVLLIAAVTIATINSGERHGRLDPRSADRQGSRAVAELLSDRGVDTRVVTTSQEAAAATGPDTTLLVARSNQLDESQKTALKAATDLAGGRTVLLGPDEGALELLAPGVRSEPPAAQRVLAPGCELPAASSAGRARTGGPRYSTEVPGAVSCYPSQGHPTVLLLPGTTPGGDTLLLGSPDILQNEHLAHEGNAALALQLLGSRPHLVWYLPSLADPAATAEGSSSFLDLIPSGWLWGALQLFLAAGFAAVWRARRLGPLVTEDLPVAIRASEASEGRARLYHRADARAHAADVLRTAARNRLATLLAVPSSGAHDPAVLLTALRAALPASEHDPHALLFGPTPSDDAALLALVDHLDALEREVRTS